MDEQMTFPQFVEKIRMAPRFKTMAVPVDLLIEAEYNPKKYNDDKFQGLKASMRQDPDFAKLRPVIINAALGREGIIFAGIHRLKAAIELEWKMIPAIIVDVDINKEKEWNLKDNVEGSDWDEDARKKQLMELHDVGYDMSGVGFGPTELVDMMGYEAPSSIVTNKEDPNYKGTTPGKRGKVKAAMAAEIECPECHYKWSIGQRTEDPGSE